MSLFRKSADDLANGFEEAKVKHLIGFVEDKYLGCANIGFASRHVVEEAAWRGDKYVNASAQGLDLWAVRNAAKYGRYGHIQFSRIGAETIADLSCEFASW